MNPITKNTLLISIALCGSLALLGAGLYLRAVATNEPTEEVTEVQAIEEIKPEDMFVDEDFDQELSDEELAQIIAEISGEEAADMDLELETERMKPESNEGINIGNEDNKGIE